MTYTPLAPTTTGDDGSVLSAPPAAMQIRKRNGGLETADVMKIVRAVERSSGGLGDVDPLRVATRTISGLYDGATTRELDELSIRTAASLIAEEPEYSKLAARLLGVFVDKEVHNQDIMAFSQSVKAGSALGLIDDGVARFVSENARKLNDAIQPERNTLFEYFGIRTLYDRYLLKHPETRHSIETPQHFFLRVACGLTESPAEAIELYDLMSQLDYMPSSPTLFNSGTRHPQMSSCYLLDSPEDDLESIYNRYTDIAKLSKYAGGIGVSFSRVRSRGSLIRGTNGTSNGIVPWLKTLDASVAAVNQGGKRKGAACVYVETWHADIEDFLELRDNTGDEMRRAHNLNLANWVPDIFMRRVEEDAVWSLFDPKVVPELVDTYGEAFDRIYAEAEAAGRFERQLPARELYARMMRTLAQTGNGWMTFKDPSNQKASQTLRPENVIHLSNLCTEILEVTSADETAVCNLGSLNLGHFVLPNPAHPTSDLAQPTSILAQPTSILAQPTSHPAHPEPVEGRTRSGTASGFDFERLGRVVRTAVRYLDRVIDINFYPTDAAGYSNARWRPVGLGVMGLQDVFFKLRMPFDSDEASELAARIQEEIYFWALTTSNELAEAHGPHETFGDTRVSQGDLQFDLWGVTPTKPAWGELKQRIAQYGLRNSLLIAIAPTATIASISGAYECIEPQISNLFKRETLSGEFLQINHYLVTDLKERGLWTEEVRNKIKLSEGSIADIDEIPQDLRDLYRTAWELPQKALIDMAAARGPYIDQSQSLNLFMASPTIGKLSSMYLYAWKSGLKTTYYLRSRPATRIMQTTTTAEPATSTATATEAAPTGATAVAELTDAEALACSLENPEDCEACT